MPNRGSISEKVQRIVWTRCGGRCFMCNTDLLYGDVGADHILALEGVSSRGLGDVAHIVGASDSPLSPRGQDDPDIADRESADNLVLACPTHHREMDTALGEGIFDVETVRQWKREFERRIAEATASAASDFTLPVRMSGRIEGGAAEASVNECAAAIVRTERRLPGWGTTRYDPAGREIDLRHLVGEGDAYYAAAQAKIDEEVGELKRSHDSGRLDRVSLFAFAKLPLLVYLGHALDDVIPTTIYQLHKVQQSWVWPALDTHPTFSVDTPSVAAGTELLLVVGVTSVPDVGELPAEVAALPVWSVLADAPGDSVIDSVSALEDFDRTIRGVYTTLDTSGVSRVHLVAAVPVGPAVVLGRSLPRSHHVPVSVYERTPGGYRCALELTS